MSLARKIILTSVLALSSISVSNAQEQKEPYLQAFDTACKIEYVADHPTNAQYDYWQYPDETRKRKKGDCEDMSFYLYDLLRNQKLESRVVWGNHNGGGHMWVEYTHNGTTLLLDPACNTILHQNEAEKNNYRYFDAPDCKQEVAQFIDEIKKGIKENKSLKRQKIPFIEPFIDFNF